MLHFDEPVLVKTIEALEPRLRVAFATACAERLRPAYLRFTTRAQRGEPVEFEANLDRLWLDLAGQCMTDEEVATGLDSCMRIIPHPDDVPWFEEQIYAEDGGAALAYAMSCRADGQSQNAAWAARRAYETLDQYVGRHENVDWNVPGAEDFALAHGLIQSELFRQQRDVAELGRAADPARAIGELRERAKREAASFFGASS